MEGSECETMSALMIYQSVPREPFSGVKSRGSDNGPMLAICGTEHAVLIPACDLFADGRIIEPLRTFLMDESERVTIRDAVFAARGHTSAEFIVVPIEQVQ